MIDNLTLTSQQYSQQLKLFSGVVLIITVGLYVTSNSADNQFVVGWRSFSSSLLIVSFLFGLFYRSIWRWGPFPKWLGKPSIGGVWLGHIASDYGRKPDEPRMEKPIVFVVRQTYLTLSIQSLTDYQIGLSKVEAILLEPKTNLTRLSYVFELENEYSGPSTVINGAGILKLVSDNKVLKGDYWTNSPTHGTLALKHVSSDPKIAMQISEFKDAVRKWPLGPLWHTL